MPIWLEDELESNIVRLHLVGEFGAENGMYSLTGDKLWSLEWEDNTPLKSGYGKPNPYTSNPRPSISIFSFVENTVVCNENALGFWCWAISVKFL